MIHLHLTAAGRHPWRPTPSLEHDQRTPALHRGRRDTIPSDSTDDARLANGFSAFLVDKLRSVQAKNAANLSALATGVSFVQCSVPVQCLRSCTSLLM